MKEANVVKKKPQNSLHAEYFGSNSFHASYIPMTKIKEETGYNYVMVPFMLIKVKPT